MVGEPGQDRLLAVAELVEERIGADLVPERMIGGDDPRLEQVRQDEPRQLGLEIGPQFGGQAAREVAPPLQAHGAQIALGG